MEKALIEEKRFADAIIDGLPGTFFMLDEELNLVRANKNFAHDLGFSIDDLLNNSITNLYSEESKELILNKRRELFKKGKVSLESNPITKNGEVLSRNVNAALFERDRQTFIIGTGQDISDLKQRETELRATLNEKEVLLQEIHHRVKNNLAVISGLLELQAYEYEDANLKRMIMESQMRIQTMAMIHEKLYQSQNLSQIPVLEYIDDLINQIESSITYGSSKVEIETHIEPIELNINQAIPFALSLNEILSNALEHAFVGVKNGKLRVELKEKGNVIHSTISDNGIGFSENDKAEKPSSLGMTLIHALLSQIDADWTMDGTNGVTYKIAFRKDKVKGSSSAL